MSSLSSLFLPHAIIAAPLIMVGILVGATFCSFARARTCQNGIVGVSCRIDIPGMVFIRETRYAELCVTMRARRRTALSPFVILPSFLSMLSSKHDAFLFSFSLSLSSPRKKRIEPQRYKGCSRYVEPFTWSSRLDMHMYTYILHMFLIPKSDIISFLQCRGSIASYFLFMNLSSN